MQEPGAAFACDAKRESEGRMKGKVKRIQVETRAALGRSCHYRLKDVGCIYWRTIPSVYLYLSNNRVALQEHGCDLTDDP